MQIAQTVASRSKDLSTHVGCVLVSEDRVILSTGYNGIPGGVADLQERMERPAKYIWTSHAEENAVALAARVGSVVKGSTAYVTHHPCARCARMLIQAGIKKVYVGPGTTSMPQEEFDVASQMFQEAGVIVLVQHTVVEEING
jgi:dCMP deaminase